LKDFTMQTSLISTAVLACSLALPASAVWADASGSTAKGSAHAVSSVRSDGFTALQAKKMGAPVALAFAIQGTPTAGQPTTIRIQMASQFDAQATLRADAGLVLAQPAQVLRVAAGQTVEHSVVVTPQANGRYYLNIFSTANSLGSASSVALQVGKDTVQAKVHGKVQVLPSGERIISMPAQ
jgi:hypothetical protein